MPAAKNFDLHGNVPEKSDTALIVIDVFNDLSFKDGKKMLPSALRMAKSILRLKSNLAKKGIPWYLHQ